MSFLESMITSAWNRLVAPGKPKQESGPRLDLGFQVIDGEVQRTRGTLPNTKRCEHVAILGKTGQGKSFFLRHLSSQEFGTETVSCSLTCTAIRCRSCCGWWRAKSAERDGT